ncbi:hypothetical protein SAMN05421784_11030 [Xenorhabdus koppenhoeferi]|uniref:Uncharacterized protein n=1 Tax=Xenorhabdus koppenhoeferi TaxID=351659 RepID=A0A1I7GVU5_9GAMM|nr:hypothetical protein SAMN05421784_11030 [Xenorhabdus koppenhoeferi]
MVLSPHKREIRPSISSQDKYLYTMDFKMQRDGKGMTNSSDKDNIINLEIIKFKYIINPGYQSN